MSEARWPSASILAPVIPHFANEVARRQRYLVHRIGLCGELNASVYYPKWAERSSDAVELQHPSCQRGSHSEVTAPTEGGHVHGFGRLQRMDAERRGDDLFGNDVNIAARIEPLASAGGICITAPVHASIRSQINTPSYPMGEPILRFIPSGE